MSQLTYNDTAREMPGVWKGKLFMSASENVTIYCRNCGRQCLAGDSFCPHCGLPLDPEKCPRTRVRKPRSATVSRLLSVQFFRNAAVLLLSVLVLLTAFLPLVRIDTGTELSETLGAPVKVELHYSGLDFITLFIDSLHNDSAKQIEESRLADKLLDVSAELQQALAGVENMNELTREQRHLVNRLVHLSFRLTARSEDTAFPPSVMLAAVTSLLYMVFAVAFFAVALLNLLLHLLGRRDLLAAVLRCLCLVPGATLVLNFTARVVFGSTFFRVAPAGTVIGTVIAAVALTAAVMIIGLATGTIRFRAVAAVRTFVMSGCAFVMLCVLLLAPLTVRLTGKFPSLAGSILPGETTGGTVSTTTVKVRLDWSFFDSVNMTDKERQDFDEKTLAALDALSEHGRSDYSRGTMGAVGTLHTAVAYVLRLATGDGSGMGVFAFVPVLALLAGLGAAWLLGEGLLYFATGRCRRSLYIAAKATACAAAILLLIALIVTVVIFDLTAGQSNFKRLHENAVFGPVVGENGLVHRMIRMRIGAAPIVLTVFSLLALAIPLPVRKCKEDELIESTAGNQDITVNLHVVD